MTALSLIIAKSGSNPVHQKTRETDRYVEIAKTSHKSGELKLTHNEPNPFGIGSIQYASQGRPMCIIGKRPAWITENIVIASGARARELPGLEADGEIVWTYKHALTPKRMPKKLLVVGSGAIGIEVLGNYLVRTGDIRLHGISYGLITTAEEALEMIGLITFLLE